MPELPGKGAAAALRLGQGFGRRPGAVPRRPAGPRPPDELGGTRVAVVSAEPAGSGAGRAGAVGPLAGRGRGLVGGTTVDEATGRAVPPGRANAAGGVQGPGASQKQAPPGPLARGEGGPGAGGPADRRGRPGGPAAGAGTVTPRLAGRRNTGRHRSKQSDRRRRAGRSGPGRAQLRAGIPRLRPRGPGQGRGGTGRDCPRLGPRTGAGGRPGRLGLPGAERPRQETGRRRQRGRPGPLARPGPPGGGGAERPGPGPACRHGALRGAVRAAGTRVGPAVPLD